MVTLGSPANAIYYSPHARPTLGSKQLNMNKTLSTFVAGLLIGGLLATVGFALFLRYQTGGGNAGQMVLKLGHGLDTAHPIHLSLEHMKERLEDLSDGAVTIDIYSGGVLGSEVQSIEQLQKGSLAMTSQSVAAMENFIPSMATFSLPYVFRDSEHFWQVLNGDVGHELMQKGEEKFVRGLCYFDSGSRNFYTKDKPIRTPDDLKGMKIRVMNSATAIDMVKALGGAPTPIDFGELYSALAQGTVDGAENNPPSFYSSKHFEVCKHFSTDGHTRVPDILLVSTKVWDRLSPEQQAWVTQASEEASTFQRALWKENTESSLKKAKAEGVTVYEVDTAVFAKKVQPMLDAVKDKEVRRLLDQISEVQ